MTSIKASLWLLLVFLGIVTDDKSQSQDQDRNKELKNLDNEFWCLVLVVGWLLWCNVCPSCWNTRRINLTNEIFVHHVPCSVAVTNVFKIICSIFPCKQNTTSEQKQSPSRFKSALNQRETQVLYLLRTTRLHRLQDDHP